MWLKVCPNLWGVSWNWLVFLFWVLEFLDNLGFGVGDLNDVISK